MHEHKLHATCAVSKTSGYGQTESLSTYGWEHKSQQEKPAVKGTGLEHQLRPEAFRWGSEDLPFTCACVASGGRFGEGHEVVVFWWNKAEKATQAWPPM